MTNHKVRAILLFVLILAFGVLIFGGYLIKKEKPPILKTVKTESGEVVFTGEDVIAGQSYYFSRGGNISVQFGGMVPIQLRTGLLTIFTDWDYFQLRGLTGMKRKMQQVSFKKILNRLTKQHKRYCEPKLLK